MLNGFRDRRALEPAQFDKTCWIKTGIEFHDGRPRFSTVVTRDFSSWAIADLPPGSSDIRLAVTRRGDAVEVRYSTVPAADAPARDFTLAALAYLPPGREVLAGVMCAAPEGGGFPVTFRGLTITT